MSKRKPTSSQPGIDRYFCKSRRTESPVDEGEKTVCDGDRQTPAIPTKSNSTARVDEGDKTAESTSIHPVLSTGTVWSVDKRVFSLKVKFITTNTCFDKCSKITEQELQRIKPKKFNHDWVEKIDNWWLCHVEGEGMFCIICKKHGVTNPQNKTDKFSGVASDRFKSDAIETHRKSGRHRSALEAEMIGRMSIFPQRVRGEKRDRNISLRKAFSTAYFFNERVLAKQKILATH